MPESVRLKLGLNEPFPFDKPQPDWNAFVLGTLGLDTPLPENVSIEKARFSGYYVDASGSSTVSISALPS